MPPPNTSSRSRAKWVDRLPAAQFGHPPVQYSQYMTTIAVPATTNAKRAITNQSRRESFSIFPTLKGPPQLAASPIIRYWDQSCYRNRTKADALFDGMALG